MSALADELRTALATTPLHFSEIADRHRGVPWRGFLTAWGALRAEDALRRDEIGRYFIPGGPAEAIARETRAE